MNIYQAELYHHGIKGQRWGIRRYQNPDGSLTSAGRKHQNRQLSRQSNIAQDKAIFELGRAERYSTKASKAGGRVTERGHEFAKKAEVHYLKADRLIKYATRLERLKRRDVQLGKEKIRDMDSIMGMNINSLPYNSDWSQKPSKSDTTGNS